MTSAAKMQGRNRRERGKIYFGHLINEFGPEIEKSQQLRWVKGVEHNGREMMLSPPGRIAILANLKKAPIIRDQGLFTKIGAVAGFHHRNQIDSFKIDRQFNHRKRFCVFCLTVCFFL